MTDILAKICTDKRKHIMERKAKFSEAALRSKIKGLPNPRSFKEALIDKISEGKPALIAEIKKASPSRGVIRTDFAPAKLAKAYEEGGAACLSILTDKFYFDGRDEYIQEAKSTVSLPTLRKDFILDPYQVIESRAIGADCILIIMAAIDDAQASELELVASDLGMDVLVEVHDREELDRALSLNANNKHKIIGINNRNLKTLKISLETSEELAAYIPKEYVGVCESGIATPEDIARIRSCGLHAFLVGESLMRKNDVAMATRILLGL